MANFGGFENEIEPNTPGLEGRHQLRMAHLSDRDIPREVVGDIFKQAEETSLVLRVGRQVPVGLGETVVRVDGVDPEVGQVGVGTRLQDREGYLKPVSGVSWGEKAFRPIKMATIVTASTEFEKADPNGFAADLQGKFARAIGRGVDLAVFHNQRPDTGGDLLGTDLNGYVNETSNRIDLPASPNDLFDTLLDGYDLVYNTSERNLNAWTADEGIRSTLLRARDPQGNPLYSDNLTANFSSLHGLPVHYGKAVSGRVGVAGGTNVKLIGGDFSQLVYGYATNIEFKREDSASITDANNNTVHLWQTNQVAYLVEVTFGWLVNDPNAFVAFETPAVSS